MAPRVLVIDNYDSFTYNLVQYLGELGVEPLVHRHDALTLDADHCPRPRGRRHLPRARHARRCRPVDGRDPDVRRSTAPCSACASDTSASARSSAARIVRAPQVMHGKTSLIRHDGRGVFTNLPDPLEATRYHSLVVDRASVPAELEITAETDDGTIMGLRHREHAVEGVQFHPESILTVSGHDLLRNFLDQLASHA